MSKAKVLVVDDEQDILESLCTLLEATLDVETVQAANGQDALEKLQGISVVLSDYKMPGMNGLDFLREVRNRMPKVPRVLMTAFPDLKIAIEAINDAKIESFFTKPLDPDRIVEGVQDLLSEQKRDRDQQAAFARAMDQARRKP